MQRCPKHPLLGVNAEQLQHSPRLLRCDAVAQIYNRPRYDDIMPTAFARWADKLEAQFAASIDFELVLHRERSIGFVGTTTISPNSLYLRALYFYPEFQRRGFGCDMLERLKSRVRHTAGGRIFLVAHKQAHWAISFYTRTGFIPFTDDLTQLQDDNDIDLRSLAPPMTELMVWDS